MQIKTIWDVIAEKISSASDINVRPIINTPRAVDFRKRWTDYFKAYTGRDVGPEAPKRLQHLARRIRREKECRQEAESAPKGSPATSASEEEKGSAPFSAVTKDVNSTTKLFGNPLGKSFSDNRKYRVKYDRGRLSSSQVKVIEQYFELLRSKGVSNIKLVGFGSADSKSRRKYVIKIECFTERGKPIGRSQIGSRVLHYYPSRIVGILNMVFAASNVANTYSLDDPMIKYVKDQYKMITGNDPSQGFDIRKIVLPRPAKIDLDEADDLNKLAVDVLKAA